MCSSLSSSIRSLKPSITLPLFPRHILSPVGYSWSYFPVLWVLTRDTFFLSPKKQCLIFPPAKLASSLIEGEGRALSHTHTHTHTPIVAKTLLVAYYKFGLVTEEPWYKHGHG